MSVVFAGNNSGRFVSNGNSYIINLRSDLDFLWVRNETVSYAAGAGTGAEFYWQRGMAVGRGTIYTKTAGTNALQVGQIAANAGFYLVDSSDQTPGPLLALTGITAGLPPVVNTVNTASLSTGDVVRILSVVGAQQLGGIEFTVGAIVPGVSFTLAYMGAIVLANPGAGNFRRIPYDPYFYPRRRIISNITQAAQGVVTTTVTHGYTIGQKIRFIIPEVTSLAFGMTELNGVEATIVAIDTVLNTFTIDIDTSGFTAFAFALTADQPFTPPQVVPLGEDTAEALNQNQNILGDATVNQALIGIKLVAGVDSPAGVNGDVIYWVAGKSFNQ